MDNNEKKEYLNLQIAMQSPTFISELVNKDKYLNSIPKVLYKYRKFDEFTFDMIENSYVYLAPAGKLDDPFDCLTATDSNEIYDNKKLTIKNDIIDYIFDIVNNHPHSGEKSEDELKDIAKRTIVNGKIDSNLVKKEMQNTFNYSDEQVDFMLSILEGVDNMIPNITDDKKFKSFLKKLVLSKEKVGVCSFTTNKDNKPMWSLYADVYKGYCIEYVTPKRKNVVNNLCPVIYSKEFENNIFKTLIEFAI